MKTFKKVVLSISVLSSLVSFTGCSKQHAAAKQELIVKEYKVTSIDQNGYYSNGKNEGLFFTKEDTKLNIHVGDKIKATFTKKQFKTGEGVTKIELNNK
jgi:hypothetical protein